MLHSSFCVHCITSFFLFLFFTEEKHQISTTTKGETTARHKGQQEWRRGLKLYNAYAKIWMWRVLALIFPLKTLNRIAGNVMLFYSCESKCLEWKTPTSQVCRGERVCKTCSLRLFFSFHKQLPVSFCVWLTVHTPQIFQRHIFQPCILFLWDSVQKVSRLFFYHLSLPMVKPQNGPRRQARLTALNIRSCIS